MKILVWQFDINLALLSK